jgi:hypothetical protein
MEYKLLIFNINKQMFEKKGFLCELAQILYIQILYLINK